MARFAPLLVYSPATQPAADGKLMQLAASTAAAATAGMPAQVALNYICALHVLGLLVAAPHSADPEQRQQEAANMAANQSTLAALGAMQHLLVLCVHAGGAPSAPVRVKVGCLDEPGAMALCQRCCCCQRGVQTDVPCPLSCSSPFCLQALQMLGGLIAVHATNQEALAGAVVHMAGQPVAALDALLHVVLSAGVGEADAAEHVLFSFLVGNTRGQDMLASTCGKPGKYGPW